MSTCISSHGEYGSHTLDSLYTCTLCHVLDEDALRSVLEQTRAFLAEAAQRAKRAETEVERLKLALTEAEVDRLKLEQRAERFESERDAARNEVGRLDRERVEASQRAERAEAHLVDALAALTELEPLRPDGHEVCRVQLQKAITKRDEFRQKWSEGIRKRLADRVRVQPLVDAAATAVADSLWLYVPKSDAAKALLAAVQVYNGEVGTQTAHVEPTVDEMRATVDRKVGELMHWCALNLGNSYVHREIRRILLVADDEYPWQLPVDSEATMTVQLDPAHEAVMAVKLDADLADINRRAAADKRVLDAAEAWHDWFPYVDSMFVPENALLYAVRARRALADPEIATTRPVPLHRHGRHQPRNLYRGDEYIGVCFDPDDAALVVAALNGLPARVVAESGGITHEIWDDTPHTALPDDHPPCPNHNRLGQPCIFPKHSDEQVCRFPGRPGGAA